jgi:predicted ATPase
MNNPAPKPTTKTSRKKAGNDVFSEPDVRLLHSIHLRNILSFGPDTEPLELRPLNVLIGPNGSGKSNLLDCIGLLQSAPSKIAATIRTEGSVQEWLWKGAQNPTAHIEAVIRPAKLHRPPLRHWFEFTESAHRFELVNERIETSLPAPNQKTPYLFFGYEGNRPMVNAVDFRANEALESAANGIDPASGRVKRVLRREDIDPELSILAQRYDADLYPEHYHLHNHYKEIRLYRNWVFGREAPIRKPQRADIPGGFLLEDSTNLASVLNQLRRNPPVKKRIVELLNEIYEGIDDYETFTQAGYIELHLNEGGRLTSASRLSDGTLRYLCLLAILCHPTPPPLICIEEPELGLHPDAVVAIGRLIKEASERTQIIITTHSDIIVDSVSPEDVIVCEKHDGQTQMERLDESALKVWLEKYSLSQLWTRGHLGGNRW